MTTSRPVGAAPSTPSQPTTPTPGTTPGIRRTPRTRATTAGTPATTAATPATRPTPATTPPHDAVGLTLDPVSLTDFLAASFERRPLTIPRAEPRRFDGILSAADVERLVC